MCILMHQMYIQGCKDLSICPLYLLLGLNMKTSFMLVELSFCKFLFLFYPPIDITECSRALI